MRFLTMVAAFTLLAVTALCVALAAAGCNPTPSPDRRYCQTPQHGEACGPSPTVHPSP